MCKYGCLGYGDCTRACAFDAIHIVDGIAKVDREKCVGCGACAAVCPNAVISIIPEHKRKPVVLCQNKDKGADTRKACTAGCIGCMKCAKACPNAIISIIPEHKRKPVVLCQNRDKGAQTRKACSAGCIGCMKCAKACPKQAITVENNLAYIDQEKCVGCGLCAKECPVGVIHVPAAYAQQVMSPAQEEALAMSDTVVVMDEGKIQQIGTPEDIYNEPKNAFVADFIGESNIIDGIMRADGVVEIFNRRFQCLDKGFAKDEPVDVVIRPEDVDIVPEGQGQLKGTVTSVTFKGMQYDIIVDFYGFKWLIQTTDLSPVGSRIGIKIDPDGIHVMKKSHYSGMFGDYSSYSEEYEEISDADYDPEAEDQEAEHEEE